MRSWGGWRRWLVVLAALLGVFGAGGVARAAEEIAADAPIAMYNGPWVHSPYTDRIERRLAGGSALSNVVPTVSGRLSRVTVYFADRTFPEVVPVVQNLFVDLARVDAEGRPTDVLATASVPFSSLPKQQRVASDVVFGAGPQVIAGERYALVYRADGCCLVTEATQETASVPDGWIGTIEFGTTTTNWSHRFSDYPDSYPGTIGVRMWVDTAPSNALEGLLDPLLPTAPPQPAVPPRLPDAPPLCGRPVMLTSVALRGRDVRLAGVARAVYAGARVTISAAGRPVAVAIVEPDGTFHTTARRTRRSAKLRYQAFLEDQQSVALRATRLLIIDSQTATAGGVRVRGHLISRRRAHRTLAVTRQLGCSGTRTPNAKIVRTDRRGRFNVTLPTPPADELIAVYRLRTTSGGKTYTLPLVLRTP